MWLSLAHGHDRAEEGHSDQEITRDLLGPAERIVEDVAGEELQEDHDRKRPEDDEDEAVVPPEIGQVDLVSHASTARVGSTLRHRSSGSCRHAPCGSGSREGGDGPRAAAQRSAASVTRSPAAGRRSPGPRSHPAVVELHRRVAEGRAVDLVDVHALVLEPLHEFLLLLDDLAGGAVGGFLDHLSAPRGRLRPCESQVGPPTMVRSASVMWPVRMMYFCTS